MKAKSKAVLLALSFVIIVVASVFGTLAYLTDTDEVVNTFTVGKVYIKLDEAEVDKNGKALADGKRVDSNNYHLLPGQEYDKDPTVTVLAGSDASYVRIMVTVNKSRELDVIFDKLNAADLKVSLSDVFSGYKATDWRLENVTENQTANTRTYEFRYKEIVSKSETSTELPELFTKIKVPGEIDEEMFALLYYKTKVDNGKVVLETDDSGQYIPLEDYEYFKIDIKAHAIQAAGFEENEDGAWAAFDGQHGLENGIEKDSATTQQ